MSREGIAESFHEAEALTPWGRSLTVVPFPSSFPIQRGVECEVDRAGTGNGDRGMWGVESLLLYLSSLLFLEAPPFPFSLLPSVLEPQGRP